jgi:hypothetical protein
MITITMCVARLLGDAIIARGLEHICPSRYEEQCLSLELSKFLDVLLNSEDHCYDYPITV